jgi:hypothetical protein
MDCTESYKKLVVQLKNQLGYFPHNWETCEDNCGICSSCRCPWLPRGAFRCSGPPATPLPENSLPCTWFDGAIPDQPDQITRSLFPHQMKSVGDMERFEKKETIELGITNPVPGDTCNLLGEDFTLCHVNPYMHRRWRRNEHNRVSGMKNRTLTRYFGIQADPVGYGKTLSVIALIARDRMPWDTSVPLRIESNNYHGLFKWSHTNTIPRVKTTLVLASLSCIDQWVKDFTFAPDLKVLVVRTTKTVKKFCSPVCRPDFPYDVVLTTPSMYKKIAVENTGVAWKRFVFDEPAHLKIPGMDLPVAGFTWFVTATPNNISYAQGSNWVGRTIQRMSGAMYSYYQSIMLFTVRNPTAFVQQSFGMPETTYRSYKCRQRLVSGLRGIVSTEILARIEAGDIQGAISAMGAERMGIGSLVDVIKDKKMRRREEIEFHLGRAQTPEQKKKWEKSLAEIDSQIAQLEATAKEDLESACPICLEDLKEPLLEPSCQQLFCAECLLKWVAAHSTCPKCRATVSGRELIYLSDETKGADETKESRSSPTHPTKIECMAKIFQDRLRETPDARFIVASQYSGGYFTIQKCLDAMQISWCELSGRASRRRRLIESFNKGEIKAIFLGGLESTAGVNLQAATDVLMYNQMSESIRAQIIGRANRIGRKRPLTVHTMVY